MGIFPILLTYGVQRSPWVLAFSYCIGKEQGGLLRFLGVRLGGTTEPLLVLHWPDPSAGLLVVREPGK